MAGGPLARLPAAWQARVQPLQAWWAARAERERRLLRVAAWVVGLGLLWGLALQPALRTLRQVPAQIDDFERQLQAMQLQADEARALRATPPVARAQAAAALRAASDRLGSAATLTDQGDRAVLTLRQASTDQLRQWLAEVRAGARARPLEINLTRDAQGLSGTLVVAIGGAP